MDYPLPKGLIVIPTPVSTPQKSQDFSLHRCLLFKNFKKHKNKLLTIYIT